MAKGIPVSPDEFAALAADADEFAHRLAALQSRLEKHYAETVSLDLVATLNRLAEQAVGVNRMLIVAQQMSEQTERLVEARQAARARDK